MGLRKLIRNIKYLSKINLKDNILKTSNYITQENFDKAINNTIESLKYEIPNNLWNIKKPNIIDYNDTLDILCNTNKSIIRFGDGEIIIINKGSIGFQEYDEVLSNKLKEILISNDNNILIGINYHYYYPSVDLLHDYVKYVYRSFVNDFRDNLNKFIDINKQYYTAGITCMYTTFKEWDFEYWYNKFRTIWNNKNITIICGDRIFKNIKYNIFDNAKNIEYLYIPSINAFSQYNDILEKSKTINKDNIIIIIAGPTAKVLAYDLSKIGYRCLDLGHLAKDYDAYKIKLETNKQNIGKFFEPD